MGIKADAFDYDMSGWVSEKSFKALSNACELAEWLHKNDASLVEGEAERLKDVAYNIIRNAGAIYAFSHENTQAFGSQWVSLLFAQGKLRLPEFSRLVTGKVPLDTPPLEYPESIQRVIDLLEEVSGHLQDPNAPVSVVRFRVTELGEAFLKRRQDSLPGRKLLDLVDRQSYHNAMSWDEFRSECSEVISEAQDRFLDENKHYRWVPSGAEQVDDWEP